MKNSSLQIFSQVAVIIFLYVLVYFLYSGIITKPFEGDSLYIHIPAAKEFLNGTFIHPPGFNHTFYPSSTEIILALFILLHIPLNLFNVLSLIVLFFVLRSLGKTFGLSFNLATIFSVVFCVMQGFLRYAMTQKIDIWFVIYFVLCIILLQKPEKTIKYFLKLGFVFGMLIGSKFNGPFTMVTLLLVYPQVFRYFSIKKFLVFLVPFSLFGLFWYIRNYFITGDPFYPQSLLFFKGAPNSILAWQVWRTIIFYPKIMASAFISEYMICSLALIIAPAYLLFSLYKNKLTFTDIQKLIILGLLNFIIYLFLPSANYYNEMVFGVRYSYPVIIVFVLTIFLLAMRHKKEVNIICIALANMIVLPFSYHPKLLFFYIPFVFIITLFLNDSHTMTSFVNLKSKKIHKKLYKVICKN